MFKALKTIKKIKQLQKEMHDVSLAFLALQDVGLMPEDERSKAKAQTMHDVSHMLKDVLGGKSVDEAMKRLNSEVKIEEVEQEDEQNILEIQLILGKQVLEIVLDLLKDDSKTGVVLPLNINDREFTITVEKEVTDRD